MLTEYDLDSATGQLYVCKRLNDEGRRAFPCAVASGDRKA